MRDESGKVKIFLSYASEDEKMRKELDKRLGSLKAQDQVTIWHDGKILPGKERNHEINENLETSHIILLLVSPDFISEDNYRDAEIKLAMEKYKEGQAFVIPILLRPGNYKGFPFDDLEYLPKSRKAISRWTNHDEAYKEVVEGIREAIEAMRVKLSPPPPKEYFVGQKIGNYSLVKLLGQGGFARVYLGEHIHLHTQAAIKILNTQVEDELREKFKQEARTIAKLEHPYIVRVLDFGVENSIPFLVMSYAPNGTLRQRHPRGTRLPLATVISYMKQIAPALHYAHEQKLIHRDIKPENLLIGSSNDILLSDFGIATVAHDPNSLSTELESVVGTPVYMAPEQFKGKPRQASDQYALAVIVYEWLCGTPPFSGEFLQLWRKHMRMTPPSLLGIISPAVEQVVRKALSKDPKKRYPNVLDFVIALEEATKPKEEVSLEDAVEPQEVASSQEATKPKEIASLEEVNVTEEVASLGEAVEPEKEVSLEDAVEPQEIASPQEATKPQEEDFLPEDLAVVGESAKSDTPQDARNNVIIDESPGLNIPGRTGVSSIVDEISEEAAPQAISNIPPPENLPPVIDQRQTPGKKLSLTRRGVLIGALGLIAMGGGVKLISFLSTRTNAPGTGTATATTPSTPSETASATPPATSPTSVPASDTPMCSANPFPSNSIAPPAKIFPTITYSRHGGEVDTVAWSPNGTRIASGSRDGTVQIWNPDTGDMMHTFKGNFQYVFAVAWSPDSNYLAWGGDDDIVHVQQMGDLAAADYHLTGHTGAIHGLAWSPNGQYIASASDDMTVNIWRWDATAGAGTFVANYTGHSDKVHAVAWSPDGKSIASGSVDKTVQVWDASAHKLIRKYIGHTGEVDAVTWSLDSKYVASGSLDNTTRVWDTTAACQLPAYSGASGKVLSIAWSLKEQLIAAGSDDWQVRVWNPTNVATPFFTYMGHRNWVHAVVWAPDNSLRVASASADTTVQIWQA